MTDSRPTSALFSPFELRGVRFPNRVVVSPMLMYLAREGMANDWHFQHLAKYAVARAGCVFTEVLCVAPRGRNTHWDLGIWSDAHVPPLTRIREFVESCGAVPAAQIGPCGGKASRQRPFDGHGPLGEADAARGEPPWTPVGPIAEPSAPDYHLPHELSVGEIGDIVDAFAAGARRVARAGFRFLEVHAAHGYLIHSFSTRRSATAAATATGATGAAACGSPSRSRRRSAGNGRRTGPSRSGSRAWTGWTAAGRWRIPSSSPASSCIAAWTSSTARRAEFAGPLRSPTSRRPAGRPGPDTRFPTRRSCAGRPASRPWRWVSSSRRVRPSGSSNVDRRTSSCSRARPSTTRTGCCTRPASSNRDSGWKLWPPSWGWWLAQRERTGVEFDD